MPATERPRIALLMTCDQFPLGGLGCYGNEWVDSGSLDGLAARGFVADNCLANRVENPVEDLLTDLSQQAEALSQAGHRLIVLEEAGLPSLAGRLPGAEILSAPAADIGSGRVADLPFARLLQNAREVIAEAIANSPSTIIWLRSAGICEDDIPPTEAWELYADEMPDVGDEPTNEADEAFLDHPALRAASLTLFDYELGEFLKELSQVSAHVLGQWTALGGWPWVTMTRSHEIAGGLESARIQLPWIVWESFPDGEPPAWEPGRSSGLVQTSDVLPTLLHWLGLKVAAPGIWPQIRGEGVSPREFVVTRGTQGAYAVRFPRDHWVLKSLPSGTSPQEATQYAQHFWHPEDPWNVFPLPVETPAQFERVVSLLADQVPGDSRESLR